MKKYLFYFVMMALIVAVPLAAISGFLIYRKLTFSYDYCEPYGQIDSQIGWTLKPNTNSCLSLKNHISGKVFFDTAIYTNDKGFRDRGPGRLASTNAVTLIGDSWTFGYGVNYRQSFSYVIEEQLGLPTVNMGVPGHGSGSTLQLFSRHLQTLQPKAVVYYTMGHWMRSLCSEAQIDKTLVPCFYIDRNGDPKLALPPEDLVESSARDHQYPGGYLTSGYKFREMLLILKPREIWQGIQTYIASLMLRMGVVDPKHDLDSDSKQANLNKILRYELSQYTNLLANTETLFMLYDPEGYYENVLSHIKGTLGHRFIYVGKEAWSSDIASKFKTMSVEQIKVPGDGHWGEGVHRLIGESMGAALVKAGVLTQK